MNETSTTLSGYLLASAKQVFEMMIGIPAGNGSITDAASSNDYDVSSVLTFSGSHTGMVALRCDIPAARVISNALAGGMLDDDDPGTLADAMGEVANMIIGSAKARFESGALRMSCPSTIVSSAHALRVSGRQEFCLVSVPTEAGEIVFEVIVNTGTGEPLQWSAVEPAGAVVHTARVS